MASVIPKVTYESVSDLLFPRSYISEQPLETGIAGRGTRLRRLLALTAFIAINFVVLVVPFMASQGAFLNHMSNFIAYVSIFTFLLFYVGVRVAGRSGSVLSVYRSVVFCIGVYLYTFLTLLVLFFTAPGVAGVQSVAVPMHVESLVARPPLFVFDQISAVALSANTLSAQVFYLLVLVALVYFLYAIYLAARIRHGASKVGAAAVTLLTAAAYHIVYWLNERRYIDVTANANRVEPAGLDPDTVIPLAVALMIILLVSYRRHDQHV